MTGIGANPKRGARSKATRALAEPPSAVRLPTHNAKEVTSTG